MAIFSGSLTTATLTIKCYHDMDHVHTNLGLYKGATIHLQVSTMYMMIGDTIAYSMYKSHLKHFPFLIHSGK